LIATYLKTNTASDFGASIAFDEIGVEAGLIFDAPKDTEEAAVITVRHSAVAMLMSADLENNIGGSSFCELAGARDTRLMEILFCVLRL
jgi:hypothetical protein